MGFRLIEGFELYNGAGSPLGAGQNWSYAGSGGSSMQPGRFGGQSLYLDGSAASSRQAVRSLGEPFSSGCLGCAVRPLDAAYGDLIILEDAAAADQIVIKGVSQGEISIDIGSTEILRSDTPLIDGLWHYLEMVFVCSDTEGQIKFWWDGTPIFDTPANLDTLNTINLISQIRLYAGSSSKESYFDDLYVTDTPVRVGERKITGFLPNSTILNTFVPLGGGSNHLQVDEVAADGDTSYVSGSNRGDTDTYGFPDFAENPQSVDCVKFHCVARATDVAEREIKVQVISGATTDDGPNFVMSTTFDRFERMFELDPNGDIAWTPAAINALQGGPKVFGASFSVNPTIYHESGTLNAVGDTLFLDPGEHDRPSATYQWYADDVAIGGATGLTYTLTSSELGADITAKVTLTDGLGSVVATSNTLGPVVNPAFATETLTLSSGGNITLSDASDLEISNRTQ